MLYYLEGKLALRDTNLCVIDCGGVGYQLTTSLLTSEALGAKVGSIVKLYTHLAVREDGIELFGFNSYEEKSTFNLLIGVSGIGPKAAINILSTLSPEKLALAVCSEDTKSIAKAPGIGAKSAARIILELKDKVAKDMMLGGSKESSISNINAQHIGKGNLSEASEALAVLGYDKNSILNALKGIDPETEVGLIIKTALKKLSR